jgi:hypothetical protein
VGMDEANSKEIVPDPHSFSHTSILRNTSGIEPITSNYPFLSAVSYSI